MNWKTKLLTDAPLKLGETVYFKTSTMNVGYIIREVDREFVRVLEAPGGQLHEGHWRNIVFTRSGPK